MTCSTAGAARHARPKSALHRVGTLLLQGVSLAVLCATSAEAQQASSPPTDLDEITVTATKQEELVIDTLAAVSVRTRDDLRRDQAQRIGSTLSQIPGVTSQENPNDPATAVNIRGLQDFGRVAVTVDGARQNFQRSGHNANGAFFLDPAFIRMIDVTRGPVANIYGSGAIGGVVSFETIRPGDILKPGERAAVELAGTGIGARQTGWFGSAIGAVRPSDTLSALAGFALRNTGNYRNGLGTIVQDSGQDIGSAIGKVEISPADGHQFGFGGQYQKYDFANGIGTATQPRRKNDVNTDTLTTRYSFSRPDLPWLNIAATAYTTGTDTEQRRISGTATQRQQDRYFRIRTNGFDVNNTSKFEFEATKVDLTVGADAFNDRVKTRDQFSNGDETTPSGRRSVYGGFVQTHVGWSSFDLIAAARLDGYELSNGNTSSEGSRVSPKLTLGWSPVTGLQFYGTYAEGYRAPAITETLVAGLHPVPASFLFIPNPNLRPEVGRTIEAGINLKFDDVITGGDRIRGKVAAFRNDVDDFIDGVFRDPGAPCGTPVPGACADATFTYVNVSRARLAGVEAEFAYDGGQWFAGVVGSTIRGNDITLGVPLQSVYPDKLAVNGGLRFLDDRLVLGGRVTFVAAQDRLPAGAAVLASKAYTLFDLNASYAVTPDARAFVSLDNVTDVRYRRYRDGDDSPGFTARFGFTTRFGT